VTTPSRAPGSICSESTRTGASNEYDRVDDGWVLMTSDVGNYGADYFTVACVELIGPGANLPEDGSNWLPAPEGGFNLCARPYYSKPGVLDGGWVPPAVTRSSEG
jgi:hypothetical protein